MFMQLSEAIEMFTPEMRTAVRLQPAPQVRIMGGMTELEDLITVAQAVELAKEYGKEYTRRHVTYVAKNGDIPGAKKVSIGPRGAWFLPRDAFVAWLEEERRPGPKTD